MYSAHTRNDALMRSYRSAPTRRAYNSAGYGALLVCLMLAASVVLVFFGPRSAPTAVTVEEAPRVEPVPLRTGERKERLTLSTPHGDIVMRLLWNNAPKTCEHFTRLAEMSFFSRATFYRAELNTFYAPANSHYSLIQGGALDRDKLPLMSPLPDIPLIEAGYPNAERTVGVARAQGSNGNTEFYINLSDNSALFEGLAVFAVVESGIEVAHEIQRMSVEDTGVIRMLREYVPITNAVVA